MDKVSDRIIGWFVLGNYNVYCTYKKIVLVFYSFYLLYVNVVNFLFI